MNLHRSPCKVSFFLSDGKQLEFSPYNFEKYSVTKLIVAFCNFANAPNIAYHNYPFEHTVKILFTLYRYKFIFILSVSFIENVRNWVWLTYVNKISLGDCVKHHTASYWSMGSKNSYRSQTYSTPTFSLVLIESNATAHISYHNRV
jgi:hypothetical protein